MGDHPFNLISVAKFGIGFFNLPLLDFFDDGLGRNLVALFFQKSDRINFESFLKRKKIPLRFHTIGVVGPDYEG